VYLDTSPLPSGLAIADMQPPEQRERQRRDVDQHGDGWRWPPPDRETLARGTFGSTSGLTDQCVIVWEVLLDGPLARTDPIRQLTGADDALARNVIKSIEHTELRLERHGPCCGEYAHAPRRRGRPLLR
jgi:hypothetical protein